MLSFSSPHLLHAIMGFTARSRNKSETERQFPKVNNWRLSHKNQPSGKNSKSPFLEGQFDPKFAGRRICLNQPSRKAYLSQICAFRQAHSYAVPIKCESSFWEGQFRDLPRRPIFMEQPPEAIGTASQEYSLWMDLVCLNVSEMKNLSVGRLP